ncbi:MAG: hypothetical protein KF842_05415 [Caulobacter sp.]|nr:hypothetical protein [Caulobacter sp.]
MTRTLKIAAVAALLGLASLPGAALAQSDPVAGTWKMKGKVQSFAFTLTCNFSRTGESLAGTCYDGGTNKAHALTSGTVKGDRVVWSYRSSFMGSPFNVTYSGLVKGEAMSGAVDAAGRKGVFSATR